MAVPLHSTCVFSTSRMMYLVSLAIFYSVVIFLSLYNLLDYEVINHILFAVICEHQVHGGLVYC
jgi:hypothetical protein